ncbi:M14 family zinc carboxypeptidase, partial [Salinicoccus sp. YB14-2]|uniref:M14 family zinc carboxypeptidase n=1 Tax=Salinicoccus sp. YB14-2 TaxID=1572701 RepID=UPI0018D08AF1
MKLERTGSVWDRSNRNAINNNWDRLEGIMKSIDELFVKGSLTPSQYTQMMESLNGLIKKGELSVNDINKNLGKMDSTFFTQEFLEELNQGSINVTNLLASSVTTDKVAPFAITPEKTTLFHDGGNLFNGDYKDGLLVAQVSHTELQPRNNYGGWEGKTAEVAVKPNTHYQISVGSDSNVLRVGSHPTKFDFLNELTPEEFLNTTLYSTSVGEHDYNINVKTGPTDNYLYVYVSNEGKKPALTVYEDVDALTIKREFLPGPQNRSIAPEHTTFFSESGENIFDGNYKDGLIVAHHNHTELQPRNNYGGWEGKTAEVSVKPRTNYQITVGSDANVLRVGAHPTPFTFLDETTPQEFLNTTLHSTSVGEHENIVKVRTGPDDHYLYVYVSNEGREPELSVTEGGHVIPAHFLEVPSDIVANKNPKFNLVGDFDKLYMKDEITDYVSNPRSIAPQSLQDMFIDVTNSIEGTSYDLLGEDDFGYNLYKYESKPLPYYEVETGAGNSGNDDGRPMKSPKIVISAGVHGRERSASLAAYYFYRELLENPTNNPVIEAIRTNVHIVIVPVVCPSG